MILEFYNQLSTLGLIFFWYIIIYGVAFGVKYHVIVARCIIANKSWADPEWYIHLLNSIWRIMIIIIIIAFV